MFKYLILLFFSVVLISCSKDDKPVQNQLTDKKQTEETENPADTNLTPEEKFSSAVMVDFLNDSDDDDLASFLETEIYKMGASYNGVTVVEVSPSTWIIALEKQGVIMNYILQKYIDFKTNEYYFTFRETTLGIPDVIQNRRSKIPAGE